MVTLSAATIKAQQALSEKFGISTFNLKGGISTVPTTKTLSSIDVGTGKFTGDTLQKFQDKLRQNIATIKQTGGRIGRTTFRAPPPIGGGGREPSITPETPAQFDFSSTFSEGLGGAGSFLSKNPTILLIGVALVALKVLR